MGGTTHEKNRLSIAEKRLIGIESLQWCANNAVYFLGLIGAATYDLAGTAFLVAAITLVRNLATSIGNVAAGSVIDSIGPRKTTVAVCAFSAVTSLVIGLGPITEISLMIAAATLGLSGGFINTCTHAYPGYLIAMLTGRQRLNGLMVFYSNIAFTLGPIFGGALVSMFSTQSVYLFMAATMAAAGILALGCHEVLRPEREEDAKTGILSGMADGARMTLQNHDLRLIFISGFLGFSPSAPSTHSSRCSIAMCSKSMSCGSVGCPRWWGSPPRSARGCLPSCPTAWPTSRCFWVPCSAWAWRP